MVNPFGTFSQKLEIRIGVDIQNIDQFSLQQCANVHPLFVNLLDSVKYQQKILNTMLNFYKSKANFFFRVVLN